MPQMLSALATLAIGFLAGIGTLVFFVSRLDRGRESGCFYMLLQLIVIIVAITILIAATPG